MIKIAPSILSADFLNLEKDLQNVIMAGADLLHLDIMDGHFVPNLTFGYPLVKRIRKRFQIPLDAHLMISNPENYIDSLAEIGVEYISVHQETVVHLHRMIQKIKEYGIKAGVALNPATPVEMIFPVLNELDFVLIMSVNPGFGGQDFIPFSLNKIRKLKEFADKNDCEIEIQVDGGVNSANVKALKDAGVTIFVAGSYIFNSNDYTDRINSLKIQE